jgi:hypothetical protein
MRVCCIITPEVEKSCLKYKNRGVSRGFLYFKQHFSTSEAIILQTRKQKYYFDSTIGKYKVDFHPRRESKLCQYI